MGLLSLRRALLAGGGIPSWVLPGANFDIDFVHNLAWIAGRGVTTPAAILTCTRASSTTNLLSTAASGAGYVSFGNGVLNMTPGLGLLVFEGRTNYLLNSAAPVTQTTGSLGTGTYTLWVNGAGTATPSAGTATGSGFAAASQGSPSSFVLSGSGTVVITVSGALNVFQLELNPGTVSAPTPFIATAGLTVARAADVVTWTSPLVFGSAYTLYASAIPLAPNTYTNAQQMLGVNAGSANNRLYLSRGTTGNASIVQASGGSVTYNQSDGAWAVSTSGKIAVATTTGAQNAYFNGTAFAAGTGALPIGVNAVDIGGDLTGSGYANSFIERIAGNTQQTLPASTIASWTTGVGP